MMMEKAAPTRNGDNIEYDILEDEEPAAEVDNDTNTKDINNKLLKVDVACAVDEVVDTDTTEDVSGDSNVNGDSNGDDIIVWECFFSLRKNGAAETTIMAV